MIELRKQVFIRWSDLDPNFHVRHSAYYDFGAQMRVEYLESIGLTVGVMQKEGFGPILFREECVFRREIRYTDTIFINFKLKKARKDFSRFSIQHEITREDGTLCAVITIDAAWMDTRARKLTTPNLLNADLLTAVPKTDDFELVD